MTNWPQPFWANLLALQGVLLAVVVIFYPAHENIALASLAIASNLVIEARRERLFAQLVFAAKDLAEAQLLRSRTLLLDLEQRGA